MQASPDWHLDLWAREHYKSTIITFALTIRDILRSHGENPLEPRECTFGIFSHTRPDAKKPLRQIKYEFETNQVLKWWFPDILWANPKKEAPKWSEDDGIVVKRKSNPKEATIEAWGLVDGMPTGSHFTHRLYDDVVTEKSVTTPEMISKTTNAWELSSNLGVDGGVVRYIGTRYDDMDTYRTMMDRKSASPRIYAATDDGTANGNPVLMSKEYLAIKRRDMSAYNFSCQMLVNPIPDENAFFKMVEGETLKYYDALPESIRWYGTTDGAVSKNQGDWTVHVIFGLDHEYNIYIDHVYRRREDSDIWVTEQGKLSKQYGTVLWVGESGVIEKAVGPFRNRMMQETGHYYNYETLPTIGDKEMRAMSFQARWNQGKVYIKRNAPWTIDFILELKMFPFTTVDDQVDGVGLIGRAIDKFVSAAPIKKQEAPRGYTFEDLERAAQRVKRGRKSRLGAPWAVRNTG